MSLHRLSKSKNLLGAIERLGRVLGYHVTLEHPLPSKCGTEAPAVDVAWFGSARDRFPLMLFEVESTASNSMANNALKVFGQETTIFEKPLFFFHVITAGGSHSSRPEILEGMFGKHNYRVYKFSDGDGTRFVCDVLAQHQRIRSAIDFVHLYEACNDEDWGGSVDALSTLRFARELALSMEDYVPALVHLARSRDDVLDELRQTVDDQALARWFKACRFESYVGSSFGVGLLFCIFVGRAQSPHEIARWNDRMEQWQGGESTTAKIAPHFGFDIGYDEFLLGGAGAFVALLIAAARRRGTCCEIFCRVLGRIGEALGATWSAANIHVWTCHVAAALGLENTFAIGQRNVNALGGLPSDFIVSPRPLAFGEEREELNLPSRVLVPAMAEFRIMAVAAHSNTGRVPHEVALHAIDENEFVTRWSEPILSCLWGSLAQGA